MIGFVVSLHSWMMVSHLVFIAGHSVEFDCGNLPVSSIIISNVIEILAVM